MDVAQEMVAALSTDLDAAGVEQDEVKDKLRRLRRRCQILEARQQGEQEPPPLDDDEQEIRRANSPARKRVRYGDPSNINRLCGEPDEG